MRLVSPPSFDKQIVRDYIETTDWDRKSNIPNLPDDIVDKTAAEYRKIADLLTKVNIKQNY